MNFKLDQNIGRRGVQLLVDAGHDVTTVREQGLDGASDERVFQVVADEKRALVTLDYDFAQILRFPPQETTGIVVFDLRPRGSLHALLDRLRTMLSALDTNELVGSLWIVEAGRIRIHLRD